MLAGWLNPFKAASASSCRTLVTYVTDRPGHDHRYAIDATKLATELANRCSVGFESGLNQTVQWYLDHEPWWRDVISGSYQAWIDKTPKPDVDWAVDPDPPRYTD